MNEDDGQDIDEENQGKQPVEGGLEVSDDENINNEEQAAQK